MNCLIYSRVSTVDKQDNSRQIAELTDYAKYRKWKVFKVFEEKITGTSKASERVEFKKLLDLIETDKIDHVLVWELSRLGRNMLDVLNTIEALSAKKINIFIKKEGLNTLDENGKKAPMTTMLISILSGFAEMERETIRQRSISGIRHNVANGGSGTGIVKAYGYEKVDKRLIINDEEAEVVRLIFTKYLSGLGTKQIANYLNREKVPTRYNKLFKNKSLKQKYGVTKKGSDYNWKDGTVYSILTNSIYIGQRKHKGEIFPIEPIIDELTFDRVQTRLSENYNKKDINRKYDNVLKDLLICGKCGRGYFMHKRANGKDNAYKCISKRYDEYCGNPSINIDKLNNALALVCMPQIIDQIVDGKKKNKSGLDAQIENSQILADNASAEIKSIKKKIDRLLQLSLDEAITEKEFKVKSSELRTELAKQEQSFEKFSEELSKLKKLKTAKLIRGEKAKLFDYQPDMFKEYAPQAIEAVRIFGVSSKEVLRSFPNSQDVPVLVQVKLLLAEPPVHFVISQRTNEIKEIDFNRKPDLDEKTANELITRGKYRIFESPIIREIPKELV